jgi:hypothetical protein
MANFAIGDINVALATVVLFVGADGGAETGASCLTDTCSLGFSTGAPPSSNSLKIKDLNNQFVQNIGHNHLILNS